MPEPAARNAARPATAIVGAGNLGSTLARQLVRGGESVVLASKDGSRAEALAEGAYREPRRAVLFYATDDDTAATTTERLIRTAGFDPLKAGGSADAGRIEGPGGDLNQFGLKGELIDLDRARAVVAAEPPG
jgi:predicted dinucleotide-binding enzyme